MAAAGAHRDRACWNSIVTDPGAGVGVMYRGDVPRDMMYAASTDGATPGQSTVLRASGAPDPIPPAAAGR